MSAEDGLSKMEFSENRNPNKRAEAFFDEIIDVVPVSKEEFVEMIRAKNPDMAEEEILQTKGMNFDLGDKIVVLLRTDVYPEQYMPYMETHEKWEAYIARKGGFNLFRKSVREYKNDKNIDQLKDEALKQYLSDVATYNYDFRHEYAVFKEYQQAQADGKLEEYHSWLMALREKEKQKATPENLRLIENDTKIRMSIYQKLTQQSKHHFLRQ